MRAIASSLERQVWNVQSCRMRLWFLQRNTNEVRQARAYWGSLQRCHEDYRSIANLESIRMSSSLDSGTFKEETSGTMAAIPYQSALVGPLKASRLACVTHCDTWALACAGPSLMNVTRAWFSHCRASVSTLPCSCVSHIWWGCWVETHFFSRSEGQL